MQVQFPVDADFIIPAMRSTQTWSRFVIDGSKVVAVASLPTVVTFSCAGPWAVVFGWLLLLALLWNRDQTHWRELRVALTKRPDLPCEVQLTPGALRHSQGTKWTRYAWQVVRVAREDSQALLLEVGRQKALIPIPVASFRSPHELAGFAAEISQRTRLAEEAQFVAEPQSVAHSAAVQLPGESISNIPTAAAIFVVAVIFYWVATIAPDPLHILPGGAGFMLNVLAFAFIWQLAFGSNLAEPEEIEATDVGLFATTATQQSFLPYEQVVEVRTAQETLHIAATFGPWRSIPRSAFASDAEYEAFVQALPEIKS